MGYKGIELILKQLEEYRQSNHLTYFELAEKVGVTAETLSKWLRHKATPTDGSMRLILTFFGKLAVPKLPNVAPKPVAKRVVNRVAVVLDNSGSMATIRNPAFEAFQRVLGELRQSAASSGQATLVDLVTFGDLVRVTHRGVPIDGLCMEHYLPNEPRTRLLDAIGQAITSLESHPVNATDDVAYLVIVVTDGAENASREYDAYRLNNLLRRVQATDRWTVTVQLPRGAKRHFCTTYAIPEGNVTEWEQTVVGTQTMATNATVGLHNYYTVRSAGGTSSRTFYTDLRNVSAQQVRSLTDVAPKVQIWEVNQPQGIRSFCEDRLGKPMLRGSAFYQLTKTEDHVHPSKQVLVREKGSGAVYAGDEARQLVGIPVGRDVRVVPGNLGNFDVFIQSTSTNRVLVPGTKVIYYASVGVPFSR